MKYATRTLLLFAFFLFVLPSSCIDGGRDRIFTTIGIVQIKNGSLYPHRYDSANTIYNVSFNEVNDNIIVRDSALYYAAIEFLSTFHYETFNGLSSSAYATPASKDLLEFSFKKVLVKSTSDFDSVHPAGSELNAYAINPFFEDIALDSFDQLYEKYLRESLVYIVLTKRPTASKSHHFIFEFYDRDDKLLFADTTKKVTFK